MVSSVLVVESHADLRSVIMEVLTRADYRCDAAASANDALLKLRQGDYAYIVVDVDSSSSMTPLCAAIAAEPELMAKLVLIGDENAPEGMSDQPLLHKPFDANELLSRL